MDLPNWLFFQKLKRHLVFLEFKIQGEQAVRNAYRHEGLAYYIVRPGGLNDNLGGILGLTIEQGTFLFLWKNDSLTA